MKKVKYFWFYNMFYLITKIGTNFLQHRGFAETIKDLIFSFNFFPYKYNLVNTLFEYTIFLINERM